MTTTTTTTTTVEATTTKNQQRSGEEENFAVVLQLLKSSNPRIGTTLQELNAIQNEIRRLHVLKKAHRKMYHTWMERTSFFYLGKQTCDKCQQWTDEQGRLRDRRVKLYTKLEKLSYGMNPVKLVKLEATTRLEEEKE